MFSLYKYNDTTNNLAHKEWTGNFRECTADYRGLRKQASHNFIYNFDEFHGSLLREDNFNRVLDGMLTVSKYNSICSPFHTSKYLSLKMS